MIVNINELQEETIQTIRGTVTEIDDDNDFTLTDESGSIEVDVDDDLDDLDDDDDDDDDDLDDDFDDLLEEQINLFDGQEVTVVGELDDDDDDDDDGDDLEFEAFRITGEDVSIVLTGEVLEDANDLGEEDNRFVQDSPDGVIVNGEAGRDELIGASGDDFLVGGADNDQLTGNEGYDTFIFQTGTGADVVTDFEEIDVLEVSDFFDDIDQILGEGGAATQIEQDTVINLGDDDSVTLLGFAVEDLSAANFALI